jgi:CelD/BcsL family acetyltransferase involved in cellulose biosynthesis
VDAAVLMKSPGYPSEPAFAGQASALRFETISNGLEFARLGERGAWDALVWAMPRPSPFLLHRWLLEWWRCYGEGSALAVHVAFRGERLVGALPLHLRERRGLTVTRFAGTHGALADVLLAPGEEEAADGLAERLVDGGHDYADLFGLSQPNRLEAALPAQALRLVERLEAPVLSLEAGWEEVYRSKVSRHSRSERRRRRRRFEALGDVRVSVARDGQHLASMLDDVFRLHALRWQDRRDNSGFATEAGIRFHRAVLPALADEQAARLVTIDLDGRPVAFALCLHVGRTLYGYRMAFDPAYGAYSVGSEALLDCLESAAADGATRVEFLGATTEYKQRLADRFDPVYEGLGLAATARGRAAVSGLLAGIRVRKRLKRSRAAARLYNKLPVLFSRS